MDYPSAKSSLGAGREQSDNCRGLRLLLVIVCLILSLLAKDNPPVLVALLPEEVASSERRGLFYAPISCLFYHD